MQDIKEMLFHSFPRSGFAGSYDIDVVLPNAGDARLTGEKADQKESVCQSVRTSFWTLNEVAVAFLHHLGSQWNSKRLSKIKLHDRNNDLSHLQANTRYAITGQGRWNWNISIQRPPLAMEWVLYNIVRVYYMDMDKRPIGANIFFKAVSNVLEMSML